MATVKIIDRGCRGCEMCVDICPVDVFERDEAQEIAVVKREQDCIGCLSCRYICPSQCIDVEDIEELRPFHRIEQHKQLLEKFLQQRAVSDALTADDIEEARLDVAARLMALASTIVETMGRGHRPVGRRAGAVAATHLPEVYDETGLEGVLQGMQRLFGEAFKFDYSLSDDNIDLVFKPCGLCRVVRDAGETVGEAVLCEVFHEYWAGLLTTYLGRTYKYDIPRAGDECEMRLYPLG